MSESVAHLHPDYDLPALHRDLASCLIICLRQELRFRDIPIGAFEIIRPMKEHRIVVQTFLLLYGPLLESGIISEETLLQIILKDYGRDICVAMETFLHDSRNMWKKMKLEHFEPKL